MEKDQHPTLTSGTDGLSLRNSRLGPQERAAMLSATSGDSSFNKETEKLRSQWSDADLAQHDQLGKSINHGGDRKGHDRRHGNASVVDLRDVDDKGSTHEHPSELPDGALASAGVYCTCEQWDQYDECFERDEDDVQFNDDEEVQPLTEREFGALATASQANRTRLEVKRRPSEQRRVIPKDYVSCDTVLIWLVTTLIGANRLARRTVVKAKTWCCDDGDGV